MSIMITGAGGFIGLNLIGRLLASGATVTSFTRNALDAGALARFSSLPGSLILVKGDVRDADGLATAMREHDVDQVVHMATITSAADRERRAAADVIAVNLVGLANTLGAAAETGVHRFVYTGSIATFGPDTVDGGLLDEDAPHDPRTLYAITKSAGEAIVQRLGDLHGLDWVIARLGRVFGPYEHDTGVRDTMSQIYQVNQHAKAGGAVHLDRHCVKNWSYAPDTAADLEVLLTADRLPHRVYNLGAPHAWSLAAWCERLAAQNDRFRFSVGGDAAGAETVDLWGARDGSLLSWQRFEADFQRPTPHDLDAAFDDYMGFLSQDDIAGATL